MRLYCLGLILAALLALVVDLVFPEADLLGVLTGFLLPLPASHP